ncbi:MULTISPECIES: arylsulfatase [Moorena]|uniref:Arylsulfatase A family enzyme n=2 Tax=Moorena TaxID=1155738 RepID=F4XXX2_9CYAN|nr:MULTISPECIES: arylsulfatase [Moorena]EGJ30541.1 arylsulfatase A family enzyme [Moorena producens 3L]NEP64932.1 arylsulfatase [Moorena sp. SIO3A5]NER92048.1 arylsulfatase [Moorena sp. SIO3A2]OLT66720.1 arylsulfatase [Moorena producens 3L]
MEPGRLVSSDAIALFLSIAVPPGLAQDLPLPDPTFNGQIEETYDQSEADDAILMSPQPPEGAPNILLVLLDDVGFGASEAFGGPIVTPTLDKLVENGLSYNRFHTTSLCSPTRAALLTGRNSHSAASGSIQEMATGFPGYTGLIPQSTATVAQILQAHGYSTSWFGKNHNVPDNQTCWFGPFTRWPNDLGFDYFYGFIGGETDQWYPTLYENRNPINQPASPEEGYNLNHDLADQAISWLRYNRSLSPDTPFFLYFSPGATHAPHQPPASYVDKYKAGGEHAIAAGSPNGMFVDGWDVEQAAICANQKAQGVIPADAKCTERPAAIPAWDDPQFDLEGARDLLALQMQTYAGFLEYTDEEVGRVIDAIDELGEKDNTLIIYIVGDNGASAEGGIPGTCNEIANLGGAPLTMEDNLKCKDIWGGPETSPHFAIGWSWATDSPFRWTKQVASYFGGTRNPMVISWPDGIQATGDRNLDLRDQFLHVIDVTPTILDIVGIQPPNKFNGIGQKPLEGASFANTFGKDGASQPAPRDTQYFEMFAHRGVYNDGWMASAFHRIPWITTGSSPIDEDKWELFNLDADFTQHDDLSAQNPDKLAELQALFDSEADKYGVLPIDDRFTERYLVERPTVLGDRTYFEFYPGAIHLPAASAPNVANTSYRITADLNISDAETVQGVILANGGTAGGYSLYVTPDHDLVYEYNYVDVERTLLTDLTPLSSGSTRVKVEFVYDGNTCSAGFGCGGRAFLYVNDMTTPVDCSRIEATFPGRFGVDTQDVGMDLQAPVSDTYKPPFEFTGGEIEKVTIDIDPSFNETPICSELF